MNQMNFDFIVSNILDIAFILTSPSCLSFFSQIMNHHIHFPDSLMNHYHIAMGCLAAHNILVNISYSFYFSN